MECKLQGNIFGTIPTKSWKRDQNEPVFSIKEKGRVKKELHAELFPHKGQSTNMNLNKNCPLRYLFAKVDQIYNPTTNVDKLQSEL